MADRSLLRPLPPDGIRRDKDVNGMRIQGCHKGHHGALNVHNPQPGWRYTWCRRTAADVQKYRNMGYLLVQEGDPEYAGTALPDAVQSAVDSVCSHQDVVLMKIFKDKYRPLQQLKEDLAENQLEGSADRYLNQGDTMGESSVDNGEPLRQKRARHRIDVGPHDQT